MPSTPIFENRIHFAPMFQITVEGQDVDKAVLHDVQEVTYTESATGMNSFEFVLNDWDAQKNTAKYSSPFDDKGNLLKVDGKPVPNFEPGTLLGLKMGYYGEKAEPLTMMKGRVISISPSFPSSGTPTVRYRAISELSKFQKEKKTIVWEKPKSVSEVFEAVATSEFGVETETPDKKNEAPEQYQLMAEEDPIVFLWRLARKHGYEIRLITEGDKETLFFGARADSKEVIELMWGRSLIDFTPQIKIKNMVSKVVVKGWDPVASGKARQISGEATLEKDVKLKMADNKLLDSIGTALAENVETVVDEVFDNADEAKQRAKDILTNMSRDMITGSGTCIGDPRIRAGITLQLSGMGFRYDGEYLVKEATHSIGSSGYTVKFSCELKGVVS